MNRLVRVFLETTGRCRPLSFENVDIFLYCFRFPLLLVSPSDLVSFIRKSENLSIFLIQLNLFPLVLISVSKIRETEYSFDWNFFIDLFENLRIMIILFNFCFTSRIRYIISCRDDYEKIVVFLLSISFTSYVTRSVLFLSRCKLMVCDSMVNIGGKPVFRRVYRRSFSFP